MKAKFDKIMATFVEEQKGNASHQQQINGNMFNGRFASGLGVPTPSNGVVSRFEGSEKREGITDFKNKNLKNNMKGLRGGGQSDSEEEPQESPAIIEGVEETDQSLNIKINKRKMFAKPPIMPPKQDLVSLAQQKMNEMKRASTPERTLNEYPNNQKQGNHLNTDYY